MPYLIHGLRRRSSQQARDEKEGQDAPGETPALLQGAQPGQHGQHRRHHAEVRGLSWLGLDFGPSVTDYSAAPHTTCGVLFPPFFFLVVHAYRMLISLRNPIPCQIPRLQGARRRCGPTCCASTPPGSPSSTRTIPMRFRQRSPKTAAERGRCGAIRPPGNRSNEEC